MNPLQPKGLLIALLGKMGVGKTELAQQFASAYNARILSLADAIRRDIVVYGLTKGGVIDKARDRGIMQDYAQLRRNELVEANGYNSRIVNVYDDAYLHRKDEEGNHYYSLGKCYPEYWIDIAKDRARSCIAEGYNVIFDDLRRMNEVVGLAAIGFKIVKVSADDSVRLARLKSRDGGFDPARLDDISENTVDTLPYDREIFNNTTVGEAWNTLTSVI